MLRCVAQGSVPEQGAQQPLPSPHVPMPLATPIWGNQCSWQPKYMS